MPRELPEGWTEQDVLDFATTNPRVYEAIVGNDPRTKLHDMFWKSDKTVKDLGLHPDMKLREVIEEMGVHIAPDSQLARTRRHAKAEVEPIISEVRALREELSKRDRGHEEREFDASLQRYARDEDAEISDADVTEIKGWMKDNQYGPKAARAAVTAWLETKRPAEPNFESEPIFAGGDDEHAKALDKLGPGDELGPNTPRGLRHAEKIWNDMFKNQRGRPVFSA